MEHTQELEGPKGLTFVTILPYTAIIKILHQMEVAQGDSLQAKNHLPQMTPNKINPQHHPEKEKHSSRTANTSQDCSTRTNQWHKKCMGQTTYQLAVRSFQISNTG